MWTLSSIIHFFFSVFFVLKFLFDLWQGPRCIVVGPTDSGKSCLVRMLLGWATREGWKPTYADLDIGQGSITIPGTVSATPVEMPIHPIEGVPLDLPLVYFYGHTTPRWVFG
jgi:polyribonucleotide 5'-hydroxyl-kinase